MQGNYKFFLFIFSILLIPSGIVAQEERQHPKGEVYVDEQGILYWKETQEAVTGFGVNYSVPFAHAFRTGKKLGVDLKEAIRRDVYHFSRLGFDLYRLHVWDTEISDEAGNLLNNEHLKLFDFLIHELKKRNINFVITPIAYWGNGWPEPDEDSPGFSDKYGKQESLVNPEAILAQENYLVQFLDHVNPYTGIAYREEPNLVAFEVSNEPHHRQPPDAVREFIARMVTAMRSTGTKKPIFYNVSHSIHLAETYARSPIDGGTFQWYPTGLGFGKELDGNLLPNVQEYHIPFKEMWRENGLAKLVYEFDAADVMKSYIYPAMARSFRQAGIQIATHFAYDPTFMAYANTEYNTHYMNLAYTPQKALALMISAEVFRRLPLYSKLGGYPENLDFGDFRIRYQEDLAALNAEETFLYTNTTEAEPKSRKDLRKIAGYGNSKVVEYQGKGAYFLDKLDESTWRLEVMPDAVLVNNPFGKNSLDKTVGVVAFRPWKMKVLLPGLGEKFKIKAINEGNSFESMASGAGFKVVPGTYLLIGEPGKVKASYPSWSPENLKAFVAPEREVDSTYLVHHPVNELAAGTSHTIKATVVSDEKVEKLEAWLQNGNNYETVILQPTNAYDYEALVPDRLLKNGFLNYRLILYTEQGTRTYPPGVKGDPGKWDFHREVQYSIAVVPKEKPLYLFNAGTDVKSVVGTWMKSLQLVPTVQPMEGEYQVNVQKLFEKDPENLEAAPRYDYTFRYTFLDKVAGRREAFADKTFLVIKGRSLNQKPVKVQVALITEEGAAYGKTIDLQPSVSEYKIALSNLKPVKTVILPRPYPSFLPYYFEPQIRDNFVLKEAESLQISIGPGLDEAAVHEQHGLGLISAWLE